MNYQDKYKDKMTPEPVKVMASSFGNLDRFFRHINKVFIAENSEEYNYIYKTGGLKQVVLNYIKKIYGKTT